MTGEIFRLKKFRTYAAETKPKVGAQWMEGSAAAGTHIVVDERMAVLGWVRKVD